jgi:UPF0042 nucleotide-binding protein
MITLISQGFKFGRPDANFYFDVSYLANPYRDKKIREEKNLEKRSKLVMEFMEKQPEFNSIVNIITIAITTYNNMFEGEEMIFGICCSAGEFRSPSVVNAISKKLSRVKVNHKVIQSKTSKI